MVDHVQFLFVFFYQDTPLYMAADRGHVDTLRCLIDKGADTSIGDRNGVSESGSKQNSLAGPCIALTRS